MFIQVVNVNRKDANMKRKNCIVLLIVLMAMPVWAATDIFGENVSFTGMFNRDKVNLELDFQPLETDDFHWGPRVFGVLSPDLTDRARWAETLAGIGVKYPVIDFSTDILPVPIEGKIIAGADWLMDTRKFGESYASFTLGSVIGIPKNPHLSSYVRYRYMDRNDITGGGRHTIMTGFIFRWKR